MGGQKEADCGEILISSSGSKIKMGSLNIVLMCTFSVLYFLFQQQFAQACTTLALGRKATIDGSVMATHSNDGGGTTDPRLVKVPARDYPAGSQRPIWNSPENYPRYVGTERGVEAYFPENCQAGESKCKAFTPIGYIPQVNHTFAYFEATYGIMNEHQVGIAESTCSSVFVASAEDMGGAALLSIDQLSQIAMERATTAREAVSLMGELAEKYGFYGESRSFEGGAESLIVIDPNEAWVFHILADPTETSAIWVGQRVPDDGVAVVANMFIVREVDLSDTDNFLGRQDMWEIAEKSGLWQEGQPKDFTATFSDGEYAHKYYSGRRMWGIFHLFSPSQDLPAEYVNLKTSSPYPFSVPVDHPISFAEVAAGMRYWYNDTAYSTTNGLQGGAFGSPDRFSGGVGESAVPGSWERTIGLYRSSDSFVIQARANVSNDVGGVVWYGPGAAHATNYVPLVVGMTRVPDCLVYGWQGVYNVSTSYWVHRLTLNIAQIKFNTMIADVQALQSELESQSWAYISNLGTSNVSLEAIQSALTANIELSVSRFSALINSMLFTYADNYLNYWSATGFHSQSTGYPAWWLEAVGYPNGPPPVNRNAEQKNVHSSSARWEGHFRTLFEKQQQVEAGDRYQNYQTLKARPAVAYGQVHNPHVLARSEQQQGTNRNICFLQCAKAFVQHQKDAQYLDCTNLCDAKGII